MLPCMQKLWFKAQAIARYSREDPNAVYERLVSQKLERIAARDSGRYILPPKIVWPK